MPTLSKAVKVSHLLRILTVLLFTVNAWALSSQEKALLLHKNIMDNGGFENGLSRWVASAGTFSAVTSGTNLLTGRNSATWDAAAANDTLSYNAITIPKGLYNTNALAECRLQTPSGTATHTLEVYDGSSVLAEVDVTSSTTPVMARVNFIMPSSGTITLRFEAQANEPLIAIDDCYLGENYNIGTVSQVQAAGASYFAGTTNCSGWARTSTTIGAFATDADCPGPTVEFSQIGTWATTDSNLPRQTITNLPPGRYEAQFIVANYGSTSAASVFAIHDGTTTCRPQNGAMVSTANANTVVKCWFTYTSTQSSVSFELYTASSTGTVTIDNSATSPASNNPTFSLIRYPLAEETVVKADTIAQSWSGYHDTTCGGWTRTATTFGTPAGDATCALTELTNRNFGTVTTQSDGTGPQPGLTFTPKRAGDIYLVFAEPNVVNTSASPRAQLVVGSTYLDSKIGNANENEGLDLFGMFVTTSTSAVTLSVQLSATSGATTIAPVSTNGTVQAVSWKIINISQAMPAPLIKQSVVTSSDSVWAIESAKVSSSDVVSDESGDWIDGSCTDATTGYATCTIKSGIFSARPNCFVQLNRSSGSVGLWNLAYNSDTEIEVYTTGSTGVATNLDFTLFCHGPR